MAIEIKSIPTLEGESATRFLKIMERESKKKVPAKESARIRKTAQEILRKAKI